MADRFGSAEQATLFVLLLHKGEMPNSILRKEHGVDLPKAGREKLNNAGLVETREQSKRYFHRITPAGEEWCERDLAEIEAPPRSSALAKIGFELLRRCARYARQNKIPIADLIGTPGDLEDLIRRVYLALSGRPQDWVRLAKLRPELNGAPKDEVDQVLLAMARTGRAHLAPDSDRRGLTDADRSAAIRVAGEDNHFLAIEAS
ncbi:hypothetical protein ACIA5G_40280 [Amycolatopsis sp. NPDC051758]|uniref:hypothetical protein n=1 Tax=Amycolatopsis sp. NPDC051758 TaxID=3363935 RepID=UPI00378E2381